jgi:GDP-4-dehydro-6-deoxy-D-mannose reductase
MNCLVTGAAGQVGQQLVRLLAQQGHAVTAFDRSPASHGEHVTPVTGDICDIATLANLLMDRFEVIFHLAGLNALQPADAIRRVNVEGTEALLSAVAHAGHAGPVILMSSSAVYGPSPDNPILESSARNPQTAYAESKAAAEDAAQRHRAVAGSDIRIARPFNIIGPGQHAPLLYNKVAFQLTEIAGGTRPASLDLGNLESFRDLIDVRDVCSGLIAIARLGNPGETYNLASGNATRMADIVDRLIAYSGIEVTIHTAPRTGTDVSYQRGSFAKIHAASGWKPEVSLSTSLRDTLDWWHHLAPQENTA